MCKTTRFTILTIACAVLLTGCGFKDKDAINSVDDTIGGVVDAGAVDLPNRPGYKLRSYVVLRPMRGQHFVYVIEKDGLPVAGAQTDQSKGQHQTAVSSEVALQDSTSGPQAVTNATQVEQDQTNDQ